MRSVLTLAVAAVLLSACSHDADLFSDRIMLLKSDECRQQAIQALQRGGATADVASKDTEVAFDRDYSTCMAQRGIQIRATASTGT